MALSLAIRRFRLKASRLKDTLVSEIQSGSSRAFRINWVFHCLTGGGHVRSLTGVRFTQLTKFEDAIVHPNRAYAIRAISKRLRQGNVFEI